MLLNGFYKRPELNKMKSFIEMKQGLKRTIMGALHQTPELDKKKLMAQLCLETGFKEATVQKVFDQLDELGFITQENGIIKKVPPKRTDEEEAAVKQLADDMEKEQKEDLEGLPQ